LHDPVKTSTSEWGKVVEQQTTQGSSLSFFAQKLKTAPHAKALVRLLKLDPYYMNTKVT
jgi:hypothetical protein